MRRPNCKSIKARAKLDCISLIQQGYDRQDIINIIAEKYDYSLRGAQNLYYQALNEANEKIQTYIKSAAKSNINRLIGIIDQCYLDKRYNEAMKGIDMLNKMGGLYAPEEHNIKTEAEPIIIKFD